MDRLLRRTAWVPAAVVIALVAAAVFASAVLHRWRAGSTLLGLALLLGAVLRLVLPDRQLAGLATRGRVLDATVLLVLGFATVGLAGSIPSPS